MRVAIIAPMGSGKTTLARAMGGRDKRAQIVDLDRFRTPEVDARLAAIAAADGWDAHNRARDAHIAQCARSLPRDNLVMLTSTTDEALAASARALAYAIPSAQVLASHYRRRRMSILERQEASDSLARVKAEATIASNATNGPRVVVYAGPNALELAMRWSLEAIVSE